jgi:cobalt/nickel transport system permease protein
MKKGASKGKIVGASILGCVLTLQLGAFSVVLETLASGITELPFSVFVATMQPIHLAIGFVEGLITSAVLVFIHEARPEMLWGVGGNENLTSIDVADSKGKLTFKKTLGVLAIVAAIAAGIVSLFASAYPDGLEWSMEQVAGTSELEAAGGAYDVANNIQTATSLLPDYAFKGSDSVLGTTTSGLVGGLVVVLLCVGVSLAFKFFKNNKKEAEA